jgi:hypothetical protein
LLSTEITTLIEQLATGQPRLVPTGVPAEQGFRFYAARFRCATS